VSYHIRLTSATAVSAAGDAAALLQTAASPTTSKSIGDVTERERERERAKCQKNVLTEICERKFCTAFTVISIVQVLDKCRLITVSQTVLAYSDCETSFSMT